MRSAKVTPPGLLPLEGHASSINIAISSLKRKLLRPMGRCPPNGAHERDRGSHRTKSPTGIEGRIAPNLPAITQPPRGCLRPSLRVRPGEPTQGRCPQPNEAEPCQKNGETGERRLLREHGHNAPSDSPALEQVRSSPVPPGTPLGDQENLPPTPTARGENDVERPAMLDLCPNSASGNPSPGCGRREPPTRRPPPTPPPDVNPQVSGDWHLESGGGRDEPDPSRNARRGRGVSFKKENADA